MKTKCLKVPFDVMRAISFAPKKKAPISLDTLVSPINIRSLKAISRNEAPIGRLIY